MKLKVAVQMDPIARINIRGDSTFALLLEAQRRGHVLSYYMPDRMSLNGSELVATVQPLSVRDQSGDHFTLGEPARANLATFDVILLRQDPPFDLAYITTTHHLEHIHPKTLVVNNPASVRNAPEKIFVMEFTDLMPPTLVSRDKDEINAFRDKHGDVVMKPLYGHGGAAVFRVTPQDMNFGSLFDMFSVTFREPWVIQRFLPQVKHGDKRIILVDGEFAGAVNRVPAQDDLRSNMVRGGAAQSPTFRHANAKFASDWGRRCANAACCSSASTSSTDISPRSMSPHPPAFAPLPIWGDLTWRRGSGTPSKPNGGNGAGPSIPAAWQPCSLAGRPAEVDARRRKCRGLQWQIQRNVH